ncbi:MAG: hypothetical protein ACXWE4_04420, partial [Methylobacter sp.]
NGNFHRPSGKRSFDSRILSAIEFMSENFLLESASPAETAIFFEISIVPSAAKVIVEVATK